jgi:hypothetical protein
MAVTWRQPSASTSSILIWGSVWGFPSIILVLLTRKTGNRKHGWQHLYMRSIFVSSLSGNVTRWWVLNASSDCRTKILRMLRCCKPCFRFPVFLVGNTSIEISVRTSKIRLISEVLVNSVWAYDNLLFLYISLKKRALQIGLPRDIDGPMNIQMASGFIWLHLRAGWIIISRLRHVFGLPPSTGG